MKPALHCVETRAEPLPSLDYEWRERQHILARDWSRVHVAADKRAPLPMWVQGGKRTWR